MANELLQHSDLLILMKRRQVLLKELLDLSQRQMVEKETAGWNWLLDQKQQVIEKLVETDALRDRWHSLHDRELNEEEKNLNERHRILMEEVLQSEQSFEQRMSDEKKQVFREMDQLRKQVNYSRKVAIRPFQPTKRIT